MKLNLSVAWFISDIRAIFFTDIAHIQIFYRPQNGRNVFNLWGEMDLKKKAL